MFSFLTSPFVPVYDDDPGGGDPNAGADGGADDKTFTQVDVDRIVQERLKRDRVKSSEEKSKLLNQLEELKSKTNLSQEEKDNLQARIDDLQATLMTKEELAAKKEKELQTKYSSELELAQNESKTWRERYTNSTIDRSLMDAAVSNKALRPKQIVSLLRGDTRLSEVIGEDGKPTGTYNVKVKLDTKDKDGNPTTLDLTVDEAVKQMKEMTEEYGNLFESDASGGTGQFSQTPGGGGGLGDLTNTENYIRQRRKGLELGKVTLRR
jgi:hypothetical protein